MASQTVIQTSFAAGMLSPRLRGRLDLQQYPAGLEDATNAIVLPQGAATKRPGFYHIAPVKAGRARLVPFKVSNVVAYLLEFGDLYFRIFRNHAQVLAAGVPQEVTTPYLLADLRSLSFAQSADVMYVFHTGYQTRKIERTAAGVFTLTPVAFENGPYDAENTGDVGASPPGATASNPEDEAPPATPGGTGGGYGGDSTGGTGGGPGEGAGGTEAEAGGGEPGADGSSGGLG